MMRPNAARMAKKRTGKLPTSAIAATPKELVDVLLGGTEKTKRNYRKAFIQEQVGRQLPPPPPANPELDHPGVSETVMILDGEIPHLRWNTPLAQMEMEGKSVLFWDIPREKMERVKGRKVPYDEWEEWGAEFLIFASRFKKCLRTRRARSGGLGDSGTGRNRGSASERPPPTDLERSRFRVFVNLSDEAENQEGWVISAQFAERLTLSPQRARALLQRFGDLNWVEKRGSTIDARHRLTNLGREEFERPEEE